MSAFLDFLTYGLCSDLSCSVPQRQGTGALVVSAFLDFLTYGLCSDLSCAVPQRQGTGALVVSAFLDFLTYGLCAPYSETTDGAQFDSLLELVAGRGRALFKLFLVSTDKYRCWAVGHHLQFSHPLYLEVGCCQELLIGVESVQSTWI